jgi:CheY-like chemotaxis protein
MAEPASFSSLPGMFPNAETILVADDDDVIRRLCRRGLEAEGATDLMMPRLNGHEVAEVLSVFRPGLPVLAMSGAAMRLEPDRRLPVLAKPFAIEALIEAARETRNWARPLRIWAEEKRSLARELRQMAMPCRFENPV